MMDFFQKKEVKLINSEEFEKLYKHIVDLQQRVIRLELEADEFRNRVLRKVQIAKNEKPTPYSRFVR